MFTALGLFLISQCEQEADQSYKVTVDLFFPFVPTRLNRTPTQDQTVHVL